MEKSGVHACTQYSSTWVVGRTYHGDPTLDFPFKSYNDSNMFNLGAMRETKGG